MPVPLTKRCLHCGRKIEQMKQGFEPVLYCNKRCKSAASFSRKQRRWRNSRR